MRLTDGCGPVYKQETNAQSKKLATKRRRAQEFWGQLKTVCSFLDANKNTGANDPLPQGPWDGNSWEDRVLVPALGPAPSEVNKKKKMRALFQKPDAWRLLEVLATFSYYQDENVLPFDMLDLMHEDCGIKCNIAGYVSITLAPRSLG